MLTTHGSWCSYEVGEYEVGLFINKNVNDIEKHLIDGIIDYYDFENRDMESFPITEWEKTQIEYAFNDKEIDFWFPKLKQYS